MEFLNFIILMLTINLSNLATSFGEDDDDYVEANVTDDELRLGFAPTKGEAWPVPQSEYKQKLFYKLQPKLTFEVYLSTRYQLLDQVIDRFLDQINVLSARSKEDAKMSDRLHYAGQIQTVKISIKECCDGVPHEDMQEDYKLKVASNISIEATKITGVIRALDTLYQLFYTNKDGMLVVNRNTITDSPRYLYRGLMIDTESNYISVDNIIKMIDAMAMNKMNALHWRIVGDSSFPYESKVMPELSAKGAFHSTKVYNHSSIKKIHDFAVLRGVLVIPEFSMPGHMKSLSKSHPEVFTRCSPNGEPSGLFNLAKQATFDFLKTLMNEVQEVFTDGPIHIGGQDVDENCWTSDPEVQQYINNHPTYFDLHLQFVKKLLDNNVFKPDTQLIVAQDALNRAMVELVYPDHTIGQAYSEKMYSKIKDCNHHYVLLSYPWDLTNQNNNTSLAEVYDKAEIITKIPNCIGGEAILLSHSVDDSNIFDRVWPRACAAADTLWHGIDEENGLKKSAKMAQLNRKIQEQSKRMTLSHSPPVPSMCGDLFDITDETKSKYKIKGNIVLKNKRRQPIFKLGNK